MKKKSDLYRETKKVLLKRNPGEKEGKKKAASFKQLSIQLLTHISGEFYLVLPKIMYQNSGQQLDYQGSMNYGTNHCQIENSQ